MIVYKYLSRTEVLENSSIRFTQAGALNDPFETTPCYSEYKEFLIGEIARKHGGSIPLERIPNLSPTIDEVISNITQTLGLYFVILSLTKKNNNGLMWAHYANSHKGFAIGFDSESSFFQPGNGKAVDGLRDVVYSANRAIVPEGGLSSMTPEELKKMNEHYFFTKSENWSYEEEVRILASPNAAIPSSKIVDGYPLCLFSFPKDAVKEVILGCKMPKNIRENISNLVRKDFPNATLLQATLNESKFDLDIMPHHA